MLKRSFSKWRQTSSCTNKLQSLVFFSFFFFLVPSYLKLSRVFHLPHNQVKKIRSSLFWKATKPKTEKNNHFYLFSFFAIILNSILLFTGISFCTLTDACLFFEWLWYIVFTWVLQFAQKLTFAVCYFSCLRKKCKLTCHSDYYKEVYFLGC